MNPKKIATITAYILLGYAILGFLIVPLTAKYILEKKISKTIHRTIHVKSVKFNPFTFQAELKNFLIDDTDQTPLISFKNFLVNFQITSIFKESWIFKNISLTDPYIKIILNKGGELNLNDLKPDTAPETQPQPLKNKKPSQPKSIIIENFLLNAGSVDFTDKSNSHVFHHISQPINLDAKNINTQPQTEGSAGITFSIGDNGKITIVNNMSLTPLQGFADITLTSIPLNVFQPYIANHSSAEIKNGNLDLTAKVSYNPQNTDKLLTLSGNLLISNFALTEESKNKNLATWDRLSLQSLTFEFPASSLDIASMEWVKPDVSLVLEADKQLNLVRIFMPAPSETPATTTSPETTVAPTQTPAPAFAFHLKRLIIKDGTISIADQSIAPPSETVMSELQTTIGPISLAPDVTTHIDFSTRVNKTGKITSVGTIQPFAKPLELDLSLSLENYDMKILKPYFDKYVGYNINNGKFNLNLKYNIEDGKLKADHNLLIDTMVLGKKTDSPDATSVPVKLALYLIEDLNQQIKIDFPVEGNVTDPTFKISGLVVQAIINILTKAIASPFNLLGGMFGGSTGDLSYAGFEPNLAELSVEEHSKIVSLGKILQAKPRFNLIIQGGADPSYDVLSGKDIRTLETMAAESGEYKPGMKDKLFKVYDRVTGVANVWPLSKLSTLKTKKAPEPVHLPQEKINTPALNLLAQQRARIIKSVLINEGTIEARRISIEDNSIADNFSDGVVKTNLSLSVD